MKDHHIRKVMDLDNVIFVCFGQPNDEDMPRIGDDDSIIVDLMQHVSEKPHETVHAEFRHQTDPS